MYHFVDLTSEQKQQRRDYLDWYGFVAQLSVVLPLLVVQLSALVSWARRRSQSQPRSTPSSPYVKQRRLEHGLALPDLSAKWRAAVWWCGDSIDIAGYHLGTRGEIIAAVVWLIWLVGLSFAQTGNDYLHLTKRFGIIAGSQLPFHYLLSLKTPFSPLQFLTKRSHESLVAIHQLLGRVITALVYAHALLYLNFYVLSGLLLSKLTQFYVMCGIFSLLAFTAVGTTALKPLRNWSYRVFYITHVSAAFVLLPALYFHVHHIRLYVWETLLVFALNALLRFIATKSHNATIKQIPDTNLLDISITPSDATANARFRKWQPAQHAYLSLPAHPLMGTLRSNPFTVSSIPSIDGHLRFIARILDGNTARLARKQGLSQKLAVEGPYGLATHSNDLLHYDRILFVAGGVGATFILPLYRQLLADLSPSKGSYRRQKVNFFWVARSMSDVTWALPGDEKEREGFVERMSVYLTKDIDGITSDGQRDFAIGQDEQDLDPSAATLGEDGIELEEQKNLLSEPGASNEKTNSELSTSPGRPNLARIVEQAFIHSSTERVAIMVCGPRSLSQSLRKEVGKWVKSGREVWFWEEAFSS